MHNHSIAFLGLGAQSEIAKAPPKLCGLPNGLHLPDYAKFRQEEQSLDRKIMQSLGKNNYAKRKKSKSEKLQGKGNIRYYIWFLGILKVVVGRRSGYTREVLARMEVP